MSTDSFLSAHPDLRNRLIGHEAFKKGDFDKAMTHFRRAARYADKASQGMIAEMLWNGQGTAADRAAAWAWMAVAAERDYEVMRMGRDRFWAAMNEAERARGTELARELGEEYGDEAAKPRLERMLREARRNTAASRTGFTGNMTITLPTPGGSTTIDANTFFQDKYWKPEAYWAWHAQDWQKLPKGTVEVGPVTPKE